MYNISSQTITSQFSKTRFIVVVATFFMIYRTRSYFTEMTVSFERRLGLEESFKPEGENTINILGREFSRWDRTELPFPCVSENSPDTEGIFYIKVPKTSSSTLGKITARIAGREAKRQGILPVGKSCKVYDPYILHQSAFNLNCANRNKTKSFLWSVIRHPPARAISHYGMRLHQGIVQNHSESSFTNDLEASLEYSPNKQLDYFFLRMICHV